MSNEVATLSGFADKVKEKIKKDFAGMIPDEAWDQLVKDAVQSFIKNDLQALVKAELTVELKKRMAAHFCSPQWEGEWDSNANGGNGAKKASEEMSKILAANIPAVIEALLGNAMQSVKEQIRYNLGR